MTRNRPGSLRHNVQVLPDKKLLREKANSNENLASATTDIPLGETYAVISTPQAVSPVPSNVTDRPPNNANVSSAAVNLIPRPPMMKRPSTDSDDNSAPESEFVRGSSSNSANGGATASLPPRSRLAMHPKVKKYPAPSVNGSSNGSSAPVNTGGSSSSGGHQSRTAPILIGGGSSRRDSSPSMDGSLLLSARPDDSSDNESLNEDGEGGGNTSDCDISPKGSTSGAGGDRSLPASSRQKSSSLEALCAENPTRPKIRQPSARFSRHQGGISGSPPKSVTWNLVPDVVKYEEPTPVSGDGESAVNGPSSSSSSSSSSSKSRHHHRNRSEIPFSHRPHHHHKMRHAASDERLFEARKGIANSTLIAVHERFLEQMTMLLKEEMQLLEEVKSEKKSMDIYREVMQKILTIKAQNVKQMQDILLQSDV